MRVIRRVLWDVLAPYLAKHRRRPTVQRVARFARNVYLSYENLDYDFSRNGEQDVLRKLAPYNPTVVFDVGANVGHWARMASALFPNAAIHCFEVIEPVVANLRANIAGMPNIRVNAFGLSSKDEELQFRYYPDQNILSSIYEYPHGREYVLQKGRVRAGDCYVEEQGIKQVDFLKIDVEGAEHLVLRGFHRTLTQRRIGVIQFEYGRINITTRFMLCDFYTLLKGSGYRVGKVYPGYVDFREYALEHEDFLGPNYLAVSQERADLIAALAR